MSTEPSRPRILIVDDDVRVGMVLESFLLPEHDVLLALDGPMGLGLLDRYPVDLVLLDVMLPGMDGFEVCRRIKARPAAGLLPVILITGLDGQQDRNTGLQAGADEFLTKPVDRRELLLRVRALLQLRAQDRVIRRQLAELAQLSALKDDLLAMLAHDMRSPLQAMRLALDLLDGGEVSDRREVIDLARLSVNHLRDAVEDILRIRQLEEGRLVLDRKPVVLAELLDEVRRLLVKTASDRRVRLVIEVTADDTASVDRRLVQRALQNLVVNALEFSPPEATVVVRAARDGDTVTFEVEDRGSGVPDALKDRLFRKFGALETSSGGARRGIGLGLYMVRLTAEAHGGGVSIQDREGGGARFRIWLPAGGA